jgi:hypothetical protein
MTHTDSHSIGKPHLPWERRDVPDQPETNSIEWHYAELNRILDVIAERGCEALDDEDIEFVVVHTHTGHVSLEEAEHLLPEICRRLAAGESPLENDPVLWLLFLKLQDEGILDGSRKSMVEDAFLKYASGEPCDTPYDAPAIINFAVVWQWDAERAFSTWESTLMFRRAVRDFIASGTTADKYFINLTDGPRKFLPSRNPENYGILLKYVGRLSEGDSGG